jgi:hypothetical protein
MRYICPMQKDHMLLFCLKIRTDMGDLWHETRFPTFEINPAMPPSCCLETSTRSKMAVVHLNNNEKMTMSTFIEKGISPTELDRLSESKNTKLYVVLHIYSKTNNRGLKTPPMELANFVKSALKSVCPVTSVMKRRQRLGDYK